MNRSLKTTFFAGAFVALSAALAGCATDAPHTVAQAAPPPPPPPPVRAPARPAEPALMGNAAVWRLRSGLNVAALTCKGTGRAAVAPSYRAMLLRHKVLLDATYKEEVRRRGMAAFDHDQTKVYNRYSNQRSPEEFCRTAVAVAKEANALPSAQLSPAAPKLVAQLEKELL